MKFTQIPQNTFMEIQLNAGILLSDFNPKDGSFKAEDQLGATSGGINFSTSPEFSDFGEDIDNCPKNMKELKNLDNITASMSGSFVTVNTEAARRLMGAADIDKSDPTHVVPRRDLVDDDFQDLWWVGDYSNVNTGEKAGYMAIHLLNSLSTGGFQIQSSDKNKGTMQFEFQGHFSMEDQERVPYEIYIKAGEAEDTLRAKAAEPVQTIKK